jgi:hypothetical protein
VWGKVTLKQTGPVQYEGTYTGTDGQEPGKIHLKWRRIERQYVGDWSEGNSRSGTIAVKQAGDQIIGGWTTDRASAVNPATPALAGLLWVRPVAAQPTDHAQQPRSKSRVQVFSTAQTSKSGDLYEATAVLRVGMPISGAAIDTNAYEQYRRTQILLIRSDLVLGAALRKEGILDLPMLQSHKDTPKQFLSDQIFVIAPLGSEIVQIKMRGKDPEQLVNIVNAVTESYMENVANAEPPPNTEPAAPPSKNIHFGPVIERNLNDISLALPNSFMNLESGNLLWARQPQSVVNFDDAMKWAQEHDADIVACSDGGGRGLRIIGGLAFEPANWDASPQEVAQAISAAEHGLNQWDKTIPSPQGPREMGYSNLWLKGDKSTFYIKTRSGRMGVLEISDAVARSGQETVTPQRVHVRYKLIVDESALSFGPTFSRQLMTVSSHLANDSLRLADGRVFNLPASARPKNREKPGGGFLNVPLDEREKWLDETKVNLAIDYLKDTDQWRIMLRNVKFAELPGANWDTLTAKGLQLLLAKADWKDPPDREAELKEKGFYSLTFTAGMNPPMTFAYETTGGERGIFQFTSANRAVQVEAFVRYKQIQQPAAPDPSPGSDAGQAATNPLSDAIAQFNRTALEHPIGKNQPPLTEDEVITALRWKIETENGITPSQTGDQLIRVVKNRTLPAGARLNFATMLDGVDGERFKAWVIELRLPDAEGNELVHVIRRQLISQVDQAGKPLPLSPAAQGDDNATPLAAAINEFNTAHNSICGVRPPPLTEEEVVAAIRWWKGKRDEAPVTNHEFADFQKIADSRQLPDGTQFELISEFQPASLKNFHIWSVRIRMPYKSGHGGTYAYIIRQQYIRSEVIDDSQIAWGAASESGLQAGVRLEPQGFKYVSGQQVTPIFYYRNTGKQRFATSFPNLMTHSYYKRIVAVDSFAKEIQIEQDSKPAGPVGRAMDWLPPRDLHEIRGLPILLGDGDRGSAETSIRAKPGQVIRLHFELPDVQEEDAPALPTGEVVFFLGRTPEHVDGASLDETNGQVEPKAADAAAEAIKER